MILFQCPRFSWKFHSLSSNETGNKHDLIKLNVGKLLLAFRKYIGVTFLIGGLSFPTRRQQRALPCWRHARKNWCWSFKLHTHQDPRLQKIPKATRESQQSASNNIEPFLERHKRRICQHQQKMAVIMTPPAQTHPRRRLFEVEPVIRTRSRLLLYTSSLWSVSRTRKSCGNFRCQHYSPNASFPVRFFLMRLDSRQLGLSNEFRERSIAIVVSYFNQQYRRDWLLAKNFAAVASAVFPNNKQ